MDHKISGKGANVLKIKEESGGYTEKNSVDWDLSRHRENSHHSSYHHHHSSRTRRKKKKRLNVKIKTAFILVGSLLVLFAVFSVAFEMKEFHKVNDSSRPKEEASSDVLSVELINKEGILIKDAVKKYLLTDLLNSYNSGIKLSDFSENEGRLDGQVPIALKLSMKDGVAIFYKIEFADNKLLENAQTSYIESSTGTFEFEHLYANTEYFYRVTAYTPKGVEVTEGEFKTADTPRILSVDGLSNVRDIGNWRTDSGKRIKQGLLIRGTEMDGAVESGYHLTNKGLMDMLDVFGIKMDMDLRVQMHSSKDALGSHVKHEYYSMVEYDAIFTAGGKERVRMVFSDLADPDNYPIYLHCTYGRDRTGTICYLLEALLGVSRGDCLKDYGLSNQPVASIQQVENGLAAYEGSTLKEQTEAYLISCGISENQIEAIRDIFLGD